jgi:hypothetical protein
MHLSFATFAAANASLIHKAQAPVAHPVLHVRATGGRGSVQMSAGGARA